MTINPDGSLRQSHLRRRASQSSIFSRTYGRCDCGRDWHRRSEMRIHCRSGGLEPRCAAQHDRALRDLLIRCHNSEDMCKECGMSQLSGRTIALPEARELTRLAEMLEQRGATTIRCPLVA